MLGLLQQAIDEVSPPDHWLSVRMVNLIDVRFKVLESSRVFIEDHAPPC